MDARNIPQNKASSFDDHTNDCLAVPSNVFNLDGHVLFGTFEKTCSIISNDMWLTQ